MQVCPSVRIGVLGATGPAGKAVSVQLAAIGIEVVVGLAVEGAGRRDRQDLDANDGRTGSLAAPPRRQRRRRRGRSGRRRHPWDGVLDHRRRRWRQRLTGKIVVSMANALTRWGKDMVPLLPPTGSVTAAVARALPAIAGRRRLSPSAGRALGDLDHPLEADVMVCSDDRAATREVVDLDRPAPRPARRRRRAASSSALAIEALTPALLEINRRYKTHAAVAHHRTARTAVTGVAA